MVRVLGQAWYLIVLIPDLCLLPFVLGLPHLWLVRCGSGYTLKKIRVGR